MCHSKSWVLERCLKHDSLPPFFFAVVVLTSSWKRFCLIPGCPVAGIGLLPFPLVHPQQTSGVLLKTQKVNQNKLEINQTNAE